jgi:7-keto-8-aminopelargonate synthetase-like enzyme
MCTKPGLVGALLLTGLLSAGVCLPVCAQSVNPPPTAAAPGAAVPWSSLSPDQQQQLSRLSGQWDQLPPQRQQALASGSQRWLGMSPEQRTQARQRFNQWQQLPEQRREQLRQRWEEFRSLPPARQQAARENFRKFQQLPQDRRQQLRQRWQNATPSQRQEMIQRARERSAQRAVPHGGMPHAPKLR